MNADRNELARILATSYRMSARQGLAFLSESSQKLSRKNSNSWTVDYLLVRIAFFFYRRLKRNMNRIN